ncbi:mobilization protein [Xylanibacter rodentium]|uniref:Mobilization protein n=3 Tax=Xylanibacter rodentium TaxID=2736289 RepID=A0ABX2ATP8_9BACT|nr:mobilization protein [Xylanibacter rodentium]NPE11814.1 mobilization protein [Prevotella sp. PJ1A]NPE13755.1 mobilization protein [Xylanibacter rodentium]NPE38885.1 mobilization protein [Prevotella sp. PCJ2]
MAIKSSIHIKPCNISSSEAHNLRTPEYMRNIGESKIYLIPELVADNEHWINPRIADYDLQTHYDNIKQMVKAKTGRAMQEKERERKTKSGNIIKVAGCSPIREGVLLIKSDTTLEEVRRFGEECWEHWGITPLQIFLHKDEGHWLNGKPDADDKESFQIGGKWFKPNYHAHIVFDWMNHETGKSYKLNDDDMKQMQTLLSEILSMERGQSKAETGKEHLERNDFIIEKQRIELERIEAERLHKEHQIDLAEQELKQVKSEIRTDKLKSVATDAATALASGVSSLFGSGKMKSLKRKNEDLRDEIAIRDETIEQLQTNIKQMQMEHSRAMMNKENEHRKALEAKEAEHKEETNILNSIINTAHRWYPEFAHLLRLERLAKQIGLSAMEFAELIKGKVLNFTGRLFSSEHNRWFATENTPLQILRDNNKRLTLTANRIPISQWFNEQYDKLRQSFRQPILPRRSSGMKL